MLILSTMQHHSPFSESDVEHIRRQDNMRVDALSWLATTKKKSHHRSVVQIQLRQPSMGEAECMTVTRVETWMSPIIQYLDHDTCQSKEEKALRLWCSRYTVIGQDLYRIGYSMSLLKCVTKEQVQYVLKEIHNGVCDNHSGARRMAAKVLRAGNYWLIVQGDYT